MGSRLFGVENVLFEKFYYGINAGDRTQQAKKEHEEPLGRKKLVQEKVFRYDQQKNEKYEDDEFFHIVKEKGCIQAAVPNTDPCSGGRTLPIFHVVLVATFPVVFHERG